MKVKVQYTVEVTEEERLALSNTDKPAKHIEVAEWFESLGTDRGRQELQKRVRDYYKAKAKEFEEKAAAATTEASGTG